MDTQKDADIISGPMTAALIGYSGVFMRYALAVTPKNYLLFGCHVVNFSAQCTQGYRYVNYHYMGGSQKVLEKRAKEGLKGAEGGLEQAKMSFDQAADQAEKGLQQGYKKVEGSVKEAMGQVEKAVR
ncbi:hypothetical protein BAUCODRAFT_39690 [Baudoinia panamericana UAMH 10762]|uniref:Mitochondrial pyruvate carrier n=1 Tax=Baudoinia panamericana (strain UAMH 10762) TaxID=717646 RepID=M2LC56_BAUPA|nr:uncharacterized protein BAUCODRAFT_39690 [Baudoinia panamericana UAMH 10762]EMC91507.1 hypothetical protein BAUCODRAFT_39690 [Baudoinia panamericana UAMH 10762]